ncbi:hypothetical protein FA15DRAFT_620461 [Coprinopsis marcescibilis]|uniref:PinX1-related protein 1 n=1 Tax=Coprinopsis marcescibilis TaxID=230819 RepID=A0A5C3KSU0_COPMA|nr:hypothetical protein FA15DRAFT_620461 [Coprinopsis marcescibilis]
MGLSGRKTKQRIGSDPRNLAWADDAARFGSSYLSKFGWDASKGLGAEGEGRKTHLTVAHKLDMMGIGAAHQKDPNGIAWKQNRDFENLLKRLNASEGSTAEEGTPVAGFTQASASVEVTETEVAMEVVEGETEKEQKKREKKEKKKAKEGKKSKKDKDGKKRKRGDDDEGEISDAAKRIKTTSIEQSTTTTTQIVVEAAQVDVVQPRKPVAPPRYRAHRARAIAAKTISSKSAAHISEILGIAPSGSENTSSTPTPDPNQGKLTVISEDAPELEKITTSKKSVADYFKERLLAKANKSGTPASNVSTPIPVASMEDDEAEKKPRGGLGFSRFSWEKHEENNTVAIGMSKFGSLMSSAFLASTVSISQETSTVVEVKKESDDDEPSDRDERKRRRKEEKATKKAEKAARKAEKENKKKQKGVKQESSLPRDLEETPEVSEKTSKTHKKHKKDPRS